jgi:hypothetical protein
MSFVTVGAALHKKNGRLKACRSMRMATPPGVIA